MTEEAPRSTAKAVIVYTLLRVLLFAAVWALVELLTPIHGPWAAAAALLMSGAISVVVLDRWRGPVGQAAGGFFGRINQRIDASAHAEDAALDAAEASGEGEQEPHGEAVGEQQDPGALQGGDQVGSGSVAENGAQGADRQQPGH